MAGKHGKDRNNAVLLVYNYMVIAYFMSMYVSGNVPTCKSIEDFVDTVEKTVKR